MSQPQPHPIFGIQELVQAIVSSLPPRQTIHATLVNRTWFHASIPHLWHSVLFKDALSLLGERGMRGTRFGFRETPTQAQWNRFLVYSKYVRVLEGISLEDGLLQAATRFRPDSVTYLFPNLRVFIWTTLGDLTDLSALISPSLESFGLKVPKQNVPSFKHVCHLLTTRLHVLRFLSIDVGASKVDIQCHEFVQQLLTHFEKTLMHIHLSNTFYTQNTVQGLYRVQHLCTLSIGPNGHLGINEIPLSWTNPKLIMGKGNFQSLQKFSFTGTQKKLCDQLLDRWIFSGLTELTWHSSSRFVKPDSFITTIAYSCPQLVTLTIDLIRTHPHSPYIPAVIQWPTLRPLLRLQNLSVLSLPCWNVHMMPADLTELATLERLGMDHDQFALHHLAPPDDP
ncbi:hypothetical protein Clacol_005040 [Clathrus columnatus]|uniref:F-box domain-containing protein n=1 Tax=Clathrus columnatus TaxID=1419009 RepID=A0AAV5AB57_9AGAM|nr:hypothetical protein Clacol_005040 [Clathrus columnatus]